MRVKDWLTLIVIFLGLILSGATFAFKTFETQDTNRTAHQLMIDMLREIRADVKDSCIGKRR
jgi:hypothetical protein